MQQPNELAVKSSQSPLRLLKHFACIISKSPPYKTAIAKNKIILIVPLLCFMVIISSKLQSIKKIEACTNLSKLNNSSQLVVGIYCPGVAHKIKIISAQRTAQKTKYFKSIFFKNKKPFLQVFKERVNF